MFYEAEEKEFLGRYFKYYREKQGIKVNEVISLGICDYKTYKGIEEGIPKPNNDFYDQYINYYKIDRSVLPPLKELGPMIHELYDACEWYDNQRIETIIQSIQKKLNHISNKPIVSELLESLEMIKRFYLFDSYINEEELKNTLWLVWMWNNELSSLLIEVCGKSNINLILKNEVFDMMKPYINRDDNICKYWFSRISIYDVHYVEAENIYQQLLAHYSEINNSLRKARIIMDLHSLYRDTDYKKAEEYTVLMEKLTDNEALPNNMKEAIYYNLGMYYYLKNDHKNALINYEKSNQLNKDLLTILFICACRSRLNCIVGYEFDLDSLHTLFPYLNYFKMKSNGESEKELEKYIFDTLIEMLSKEKYEQPFWSMFNYELSELVKKTRNYKKFHLYHEKFQKATKTAL